VRGEAAPEPTAEDDPSAPSDRERAILAEAARVGAELRGHSDEIAAARRLPARFVERLSRAELFSLCVPRDLGGPEVRAETLVRAIESVAEGDASAGWCAAIASTTSLLAGWLQPEAARRIFAAPGAVAGGVFAPRGRALRVTGGYRVSGRWSFASGCEHCTWLLGGCLVEGERGPELAAGGRPDVRLALFPASAAEIVDTWKVAGLEGTGSHDIAVRDLVVPEAHAVSLITDRPRAPGPLYAFPAFGLLALGIASVTLGVARRALGEIRELAAAKTPTLAQRRLAERPATQSRVAEAEALAGSARAYLLETVRDAWQRAACAGELGLAERARVRLAASFAVKQCVRAVDVAYDLGGGSSIYLSHPLQRCLRDAHVVTQHMMVSDASLELAGRVLLGVDVDASML
jgi:alkylation response protein AidB-like acyl-CoA dehydrogenase